MMESNRRAVDVININLGGEAIPRVSQHKFLGVIIDDHLKFEGHINLLCTRSSQPIGLMKRTSHLVPVKISRILWYCLIYSRLTYAIRAWGCSFPTNLRRAQSRVISAVSMSTPQANSEADFMIIKAFINYLHSQKCIWSSVHVNINISHGRLMSYE